MENITWIGFVVNLILFSAVMNFENRSRYDKVTAMSLVVQFFKTQCILATACARVCLFLPRRIPTLLHGPGCNLGDGRVCPRVVQYWADLQSVHGFRCYDNTRM